MKKLLISLLCIGLLTGCSGAKSEDVTIEGKNGSKEDISSYIYTDKDTGCKYIIFDWYQGGGASPKLDSKGQPMGCKDLK